MQDPRLIRISDYNYSLPEEKIARFPLEERDASKLLISTADNQLKSDIFSNISDYLPENSLVILNNTRVVHARILFKKASGALIEVFCLEPYSPVNDIQLAFSQSSPVTWLCLIGNAKRWTSGLLELRQNIDGREVCLLVTKNERTNNDGSAKVTFEWQPQEVTFSHIIDAFGCIPLPPYIKRKPDKEDSQRYQTIFAKPEGSVAAPTAGLHFTQNVFKSLKNKHIDFEYLTLHVGSGTFKPVSSETIGDHLMHAEQLIITSDLLEKISKGSYSSLVAVGTTSVRCLESLYWLGIQIINGRELSLPFKIEQWVPYHEQNSDLITVSESFNAIIKSMKKQDIVALIGFTNLIIAPPYKFRCIDILVTNFHQPKSTLLLLVSAFAGENWKNAYAYALQNNFRFLSYGDSCLFFTKRI